MLRCQPFLLLDGNCTEAMTFYHKCLGGKLTLTRLGETPMKDQFPGEKHNRIINSHLESGAAGNLRYGLDGLSFVHAETKATRTLCLSSAKIC